MDVTEAGPYSRVKCPQCGDEVRVKLEMGRYTIVRRLAIGGMSVIFVARDETLGREVALKVLNEDYSGDGNRSAQFEREAELTAAVSHPNVVKVYTVGQAFDRFFIAMELVNGKSLEELITKRGALPESEIIPIALDIVNGLRAAKMAGLIHRDVKPGNILVDESGQGKIVDFGLSLLTEGGSVKADEVWATPYYVPPEAVDNLDEDFRSDIYALGASLYHALAGKPPIETKELRTKTLRDEKRNVVPLRKMAPWLRPETAQVVSKAMAVDPEDRFSSYEEFRTGLELSLAALLRDGETTPVHGDARLQRRQRQEGHRRAWLVAGMIVLVAACGVVWYLAGKAGEMEDPAGPGPGVTARPVPGPEVGLSAAAAREIGDAYEAARVALRRNDFVAAERELLRVWRHADAPVQTATWAGFEAVVASYLDGRSSDARRHLSDIGLYLRDNREEESVFGRRMRVAIQELRSLGFVDEERVPKVLDDPFRSTVLFAFALKTWEQGQIERAADWFARIAEAEPWGDAPWMAGYQRLARQYVADAQRLARADHGWKGKSERQLQESMAEMEEVYLSLKTRGRAPFNVKAWQTEMGRRIRELRRQADVVDWRKIRETAFLAIRDGRMAERLVQIRDVALTGERDRRQRDALVWLLEAASGLQDGLADTLAAGNLDVTLVTREGARHVGVVGSKPEGLVVDDGGEPRVLGWGELTPEVLLQLHQMFAQDVVAEDEQARLLEQAVAFAALSGMRDEAERLAEVLAGLNAEFAEHWRVVRAQFPAQ